MVKRQLYQVAYIPNFSELSYFKKKLMGNESKTVTCAMLKEDAEYQAEYLKKQGYRGIEIFDAHCFIEK